MIQVVGITEREAKLERRIESLEMALDGLLEVVEVVEHNGFIWHEWFEKKVAEARAVQGRGVPS